MDVLKNFTTEAQSARRKKKVRFGEEFLCELPLFSPCPPCLRGEMTFCSGVKYVYIRKKKELYHKGSSEAVAQPACADCIRKLEPVKGFASRRQTPPLPLDRLGSF